MNKTYLILLMMFLVLGRAYGQKYYTKTGFVEFVSEASLEKIVASTNSGYVVFDPGSGQLEWSVLIKSFKFEKSLMQEHFNENYMESNKYPKAIFKGTIENPASVNMTKDGDYNVHAKGQLTMHGVTKPFLTTGRITVKNGKATAQGSFDVTLDDFDIKVPKVVRNNIAEKVHVKVRADLLLLK